MLIVLDTEKDLAGFCININIQKKKTSMETLIYKLLLISNFMCISSGLNCSTEPRCRCFSRVADCSNLDLTVSPTFFTYVTAINLSRNRLNRMPAQEKLPERLKHLDLSHNYLSSYVNEENMFLRLPTLISLNLSSNSILTTMENYHEDVFQNFTRLKVLDVSNNTDYFAEIRENQLLDSVWSPLISLEKLNIDAVQNVTFGESIGNLTKLTNLTLAGQCTHARLTLIDKDYFQHFPYLKILDLSSNVYYNAVKHYYDDVGYACSLEQIDSGAISILQNLEILDVSYNRLLGLCGFRNISYDLPQTNIKIFKANFLHCESGMSFMLFCDDIKPLKNTSLRELHMDGNHLAFGQMGLIQYIPQSLERLSIKSNRWVVDQYTHVFLEFINGIKYVDLSNLNDHQMSRSFNIYEYCHNYLASVNCQKYRGQSLGTEQTPQTDGDCPLENATSSQQYTEVGEGRIEIRPPVSEHSKPYCSVDFDLYNLHVLYKKVPPNAETIVLNNSRLGLELTWTVFRNDTLTSLILSHNQFYSMMGPICNATKLKHLDLSHNRCSRISTYVFEYQPNLETLWLNDNLIGDSNLFEHENMNNIFANQSSLKVLNLTSNKFHWIPRDMFWNLRNLRHLRLDKNRLSDWNFTVGHMNKIEIVNLSMNSILSLSDEGIDLINHCPSQNLRIDLSQNPLQCTCKTQRFVEWMSKNSEKFLNIDSYRFDCTEKQNLTETKNYLTKQCSSYFSVILACSCLGMAFVCFILVVILYRYRFKLRYWYYIKLKIDSTHVNPLDSRQYRFDAFISYADEDRSFAIEQMLENLEKKEGLRLCIHHRDFMPGTSIIENISNAIHCSSKVVFVMTNSFLKSEWCMYEFQAAKAESQYSFSRQGSMMLFLMREKFLVRKIPNSIQTMLDNDTYIEYPVNSDDEPEFWVTLTRAILD